MSSVRNGLDLFIAFKIVVYGAAYPAGEGEVTEKARRAKRVPLQCEIGFRRHGDARYRIELIDFSPEGCCIAPPVKVELGERIFLRFADIEAIHGRVAWIEQWRVGVKFDQPFHPAVFDDLVARLTP